MDADRRKPRIAVTLEQCWHRVPGGTARAALDLVDALRISGRVSLIGVSARHREPPPAPWIPSIPVASIGLPRQVLYESWHRARRPAIERSTGPVDVIHVTGLAMPPATVPLVATLHDLAFVRSPESFTKHGMRFFDGALRCMRNDASLVLCSSRATFDDAVEAGFEPGRLRIVPLGVVIDPLDPNDVRAHLDRLGIPERYVLHLGTGEPRKNRASVWRAAQGLDEEVAVVFAGAAGWGASAVPAHRSKRRIIDLGFVSEATKQALLAGASVLCFPSFWEGFGLPVLEAMAHATPVVTSVGTAMAEFAQDAALLVDPGDLDAIADALRQVFDEPEAAATRVAIGLERAQRYTPAHTAALTIDAYHEVLER